MNKPNYTIHVKSNDDVLSRVTIQVIDNETGIYEYLESTDYDIGSKEIGECITVLIDAIEQKVEAYKDMKKRTQGVGVPFGLIHEASKFTDSKKLTEYVRQKAEERHKQDSTHTADEYFFVYSEALRTQRIIARASI